MNSELQAATERVRSAGHIGNASIADRNLIVSAYLAEHPADDSEPVTEDWLRAIGCGEDFNPVERLEELLTPIHNHKRGEPFPSFKTRSDVRRLLAALGIRSADSADR